MAWLWSFLCCCCCAAVRSESIFSILTEASCSFLTAEDIAWPPSLQNKLWLQIITCWSLCAYRFLPMLAPPSCSSKSFVIGDTTEVPEFARGSPRELVTLLKVSLVEGILDNLWFPREGVAFSELSKAKIGVLLPLAIILHTSWYHLRVHVMCFYSHVICFSDKINFSDT